MSSTNSRASDNDNPLLPMGDPPSSSSSANAQSKKKDSILPPPPTLDLEDFESQFGNLKSSLSMSTPPTSADGITASVHPASKTKSPLPLPPAMNFPESLSSPFVATGTTTESSTLAPPVPAQAQPTNASATIVALPPLPSPISNDKSATVPPPPLPPPRPTTVTLPPAPAISEMPPPPPPTPPAAPSKADSTTLNISAPETDISETPTPTSTPTPPVSKESFELPVSITTSAPPSGTMEVIPPTATTTTVDTSSSTTAPPRPVKIVGGGRPHPPSVLSTHHHPPSTPSSSTTVPPLLTAPPLSVTSPHQSSFPILLVPTANSTAVAAKNNLTLAQLFTGLGNTLHRDLSVTTRLPPFRSVNKSLVLSWDTLTAGFYEREDFEGGGEEKDDITSREGWDVAALRETESEGLDEEDEIVRRALKAGKCHWDIEELEGLLCDVVTEPLVEEDERREDHPAPPPSGADVADRLLSTPSHPWLRRYRRLLDTFVQRTNVTDMTVCPLVSVLIASTSDGNYVDCLRELSSNVHHLPRPYQTGQFDPNGHRRYFLVVHDDSEGGDLDEGAVIRSLKDSFANQSCAVLRLNSGRNEEEDESLWRDHRLFPTPIPSPEVIGGYLSTRDKLAVRRFVATLMADGVLPALERRIFHLNAVVNNTKRGVKNMFKTLWRKPREGNSLGGGGGYDVSAKGTTKTPPSSFGYAEVKYSHDTVESQIRLLGDSLFLVRDYDNALTMYRLVKDDYKSDKSTLYYASLQEKMALCYHLMDPNRYSREIQNSVESALYSYTRLTHNTPTTSPQKPPPSPWTKYATRLCLVLSSHPPPLMNPSSPISPTSSSSPSNNPLSHSDIADLLASTSSHETPHGAAVLLERAASHYFKAGSLRKCAFHALMAGHMYRSARSEVHGMRCFAASLAVYRGMRWGDLVQHLDGALAAQLYGLGRLSVCVVLYCVLLGEKSVKGGVRSQGRFIQHLMDVCRRNPQEGLKAVEIMRKREEAKNDTAEEKSHSPITQHNSVLEIDNLNLPRVENDRVTITTEDEWRYGPEMDTAPLPPSPPGPPHTPALRQTWKEMTLTAEAELTCLHPPNNDIDAVLKWLQNETRRLEMAAASAKRKPEKSGVYPLFGPTVRSRSEPIGVTFTAVNPLAVQLQFTQLQLVAVLEGEEQELEGGMGGKKREVGTNVTAVEEREDGTGVSQRSWRFLSLTDVDFHVPHFYHQTSNTNDTTTHKDQPFFVVDKQSLVMEAQTTQRVTLHLTPLTRGRLRILGYRTKLFNEVWLYHAFRLKGPLLQDTALHRAQRTRGPSYLLHSNILSDAPRLEVEFGDNVPEAVMQGQIAEVKLRLRNRGTAPVWQCFLKMNVPWITLGERPGEEGGYTAPTGHRVGVSGTLAKLPLAPLAPGDTAELTLYVRATGGGRKDLLLLFRYEFLGEEGSLKAVASSSSGSARVRYVRRTLRLAVYPSLTLTASLMPSYWSRTEHVLSVEVTNYRSDREEGLDVRLTGVTIASRHYRAVALLGQLGEEWNGGYSAGGTDEEGEEAMALSPLDVGWQERVTLHYLIVPLKDEEKVGCTLSECAVIKGKRAAEGIIDDTRHVWLDYLCLGYAHDTFMEKLNAKKEEMALLANDQSNKSHPRSIAQIRRANTAMSGKTSASDVTSPPVSGNLPDLLLTTPDNTSTSLNRSASTPALASLSNDLIYHPTSLANLCPPPMEHSRIHVICSWSATVTGSKKQKSPASTGGETSDDDAKTTMTVQGQHSLVNLTVRPQKNLKGCPLTVTAQHKTEVAHDFDRDGPLLLDLEVTVRNRLVSQGVAFEFYLERQPEFEFVGSKCFDTVLKGGGEVTVPLKVVIGQSGIYNLQSLRLTVKSGGEDDDEKSGSGGLMVPYLFPLQWIVTVDDKWV